MRTKEDIRRVFQGLDKASGLAGSTLPIRISKSYGKYASYYPPRPGKQEYFQFSQLLMKKELCSEELFLDTVGHEYCHYYCEHRYSFPVSPHGPQWKEACRRFGVNPRYCALTESDEKYQKAREAYRQEHAKYRLTCPSCKNQGYYYRKTPFLQALLKNPGKSPGRCARCGYPFLGKDLEILR